MPCMTTDDGNPRPPPGVGLRCPGLSDPGCPRGTTLVGLGKWGRSSHVRAVGIWEILVASTQLFEPKTAVQKGKKKTSLLWKMVNFMVGQQYLVKLLFQKEEMHRELALPAAPVAGFPPDTGCLYQVAEPSQGPRTLGLLPPVSFLESGKSVETKGAPAKSSDKFAPGSSA